jgi:hypothetical protein
MRANLTSKRSFFVVACLALAPGCGQELDVGSDVSWTARFEGDNLAEWSPVPFGFGSASAVPPNTIEVSSNPVSNPGHPGNFAAKLTVSGTVDNTQGNGASMVQNGGLPTQAYYSAWYYLPQSVSVGTYWVIMKFRAVLGDPPAEGELFDVNLTSPSVGTMSLRLYDHTIGADRPLDVPAPGIPVNDWFQLEAFYRDANDSTGRLTLWLDDLQILDWQGPTGLTSWVAWDVVSVGDNLAPEPAILYVDDCAISNTRIGTTGLIAK